VRIQICGPLAIERDGQRLDGRLPGRQGRLLFIYLVVNRHRQVLRDELAEALWREPDPAVVDARLNPLLSKLRRVFGAGIVDGRSVLRLYLPGAWVAACRISPSNADATKLPAPPIKADYTWAPRSAPMVKLINSPQIPAGFTQVPAG
jgi:hypothetical protein